MWLNMPQRPKKGVIDLISDLKETTKYYTKLENGVAFKLFVENIRIYDGNNHKSVSKRIGTGNTNFLTPLRELRDSTMTSFHAFLLLLLLHLV